VGPGDSPASGGDPRAGLHDPWADVLCSSQLDRLPGGPARWQGACSCPRVMPRRFGGLLLFILGLLPLPTHAQAVAQPPLRLVGDRDYAPITYLDSGVAKGVDVDIARAVAQRLGREIRIDLMDWDQAQAAVLKGEADGLLSMSITDERRRLYAFTQPTRSHVFGVFVRRGELVIRDAGDLTTRRVGVTAGGYPRRFLETAQLGTPVLIQNYADGFDRMSAGTIDAVAADTWVAAYTAQERHASDVRMVGNPFATLPAGIALARGNADLLEAMNGAIREMAADGTLAATVERWRPQEMMFASRKRLSTIVQLGLGVLVATALCVSAGWGHVLRNQHARRRTLDDRARTLAHALHNASDCIVVSDANDRLIYVNTAFLKIYDYTGDQVIGRHISLLDAGVNGWSIDALTRRERGEKWRGDLWTQTRTGHVVRAAWATSVVRNDDGKLIAMVAVSRGLSEHQELSTELQQLHNIDAIGRMAAGLAHDFNNLLTVIMATCEETAALPGVPALARHRIDDIAATSKTAAGLTRQLLTLGRRETPESRPVNLNDLLADMHRVLAGLVEPDVELDVRPSPDLGRVAVSPVQFQQVVINLAANARDAMPHGGRLLIETQRVTIGAENIVNHPPMPPGNYVSLGVTDSGTGMDAETRARIFDPFFTTKPAGQGTGLGLSTVRDIVTQSGGFLAVVSEPGVGSTFTVYLPEVAGAAPSVEGRPQIERRGRGEVILLVDDTLAVLELTRTYLTRIGYTVMVASTAAEAIALCAGLGSAPALLITDVVLPGVNGVSLAAQLRRALPDLKVLYVVEPGDEPESGAAQHKDTDLLAKPFVLHELAVKVHALLRRFSG